MRSYHKFNKVYCDQRKHKQRAEFWLRIGWLSWFIFIGFGLLILAEIGGR